MTEKKAMEDFIKEGCSEEYYPPKQVPRKKKLIRNSGNQVGHWNTHEKEAYLKFLMDHPNSFDSYKIRRRDRTFTEMEKVIPTRNAEQCRGHHRRIELLYGTKNIERLI